MDAQYQSGIPIEVINKGRSLEDVLNAYTKFYQDAAKVSRRLGKSGDDVVADAMTGATYRLYLQGVEDGMFGPCNF